MISSFFKPGRGVNPAVGNDARRRELLHLKHSTLRLLFRLPPWGRAQIKACVMWGLPKWRKNKLFSLFLAWFVFICLKQTARDRVLGNRRVPPRRWLMAGYIEEQETSSSIKAAACLWWKRRWVWRSVAAFCPLIAQLDPARLARSAHGQWIGPLVCPPRGLWPELGAHNGA